MSYQLIFIAEHLENTQLIHSNPVYRVSALFCLHPRYNTM